MIPKFRAWDIKRKEMCDVLGIFYELQQVLLKPMPNIPIATHKKFRSVVLMQSTGLFDSKGQEIFEGDIVILYDERNEYNPPICQVFYSPSRFAWFFKNVETGDEFYVGYAEFDELELVGNIYENPDLLEVE